MYRLLLNLITITALLMPCFAVAADKSGDIHKADLDQLLEQTRAALAARAGEEINWQVVSSGGRKITSDNYELQATVGQTAVGRGSSVSYGLSHGYWQDFGSGGGGCCLGAIRGNVDYDLGDAIDISDLVYLVDYMFTNGPVPPCLDEADMNGDLAIDISDLVWLVDYMFTNGPPPVACP
jgi:hypothetical protein